MINSSAPLREVTPASAIILFKRKRLIIRLSILDSLKGVTNGPSGPVCLLYGRSAPIGKREELVSRSGSQESHPGRQDQADEALVVIDHRVN